MSNVSTNTLFHFTPKIEYLKEILSGFFSPRISIESHTFSNEKGLLAFPMKCFCDIPLSQVQKHMNNYGKYAIGLSKEWGIANKVAPIIYYCDNSPVINSILDISDESSTDEFIYKYVNLILFMKPYEEILFRKDYPIRFYDEREWRYVPEVKKLTGLGTNFLLGNKDCKDDNRIKHINNKLRNFDIVKLNFKPKDVKYVIVENESDILDIIETLTKSNRKQYSYEDVQLLTTRIITSKQIEEDF